MAKKTKDATASAAKKEAKAKAPLNPAATQHLITLLNILILLLAIAAFILQLFAVLTHSWKYQITNLQPLLAPKDRPIQAHVPDDSRIYQRYGLYTRDVKVYANNDQQLGIWSNTLFPRLDNGHGDLNQCLSQTSTLRASLLVCSKHINSPGQCHCRRYPHWNAIIFFEIAALILLGLVVVISALLSTQYHGLLKPVGVALSFLAFLFLLIGLILILSYLKRETRTIAEAYPHVHSKIATQLNQRHQTVLHKAVRRQAHETYRAYSLSPGQHPYNQTHFQQYSEKDTAWVYIPYSSLSAAAYAPYSQGAATQRTTTGLPLRNEYGPLIGEDQVFENTKAGIGFSTVLSIIALILSLLLPLILAFSWLTAKKLDPTTGKTQKTETTTTIRTEYIPVPLEATAETVPLNQTNETIRQEPVVVIHGDQPATTTTHHT
jgi:flagellar basal body-associated protein FliL